MTKRKAAKHEIVDAEELKPLPHLDEPKVEEPKVEGSELPELSQQEKWERAIHKLGSLPIIDHKKMLSGLRGKHRVAMEKVLDAADAEFVDKILAIDRDYYLNISTQIAEVNNRYQADVEAMKKQVLNDVRAIFEKHNIPYTNYWVGCYVNAQDFMRADAYKLRDKINLDLDKARNEILTLQRPQGTPPDQPLPEPLHKIVEQFKVRGLLAAGTKKEGSK